MDAFIPLSVPNLKGNELKYVTEAVKSEWVSTAGPFVSSFEKEIAKYVGTNNAVSCQNGTSGLHIALQLCGVRPGEEVLAPTLTFIAAVNPIKYVGADPVFLDCDDTLTIDVNKLSLFCETECIFINGALVNKKSGRRVRAIIVVHVFGNLADMVGIMSIADRYNLAVIEDATEALGSYYTSGNFAGKHAGTIGKVGVYSFNGNKLLTTGGGGMIVSEDNELLARAKHLTTQAKADELNFIHDEIGYNYRMTNLQAALGLAQLEQIESFIEHKRLNYWLYVEALDGWNGLSMLKFRGDVRPNYWFYSLYVGNEFPLKRDEVIQRLQSNRIQSRPIWGLIHHQVPYANAQAYQILKAVDYWQHVVNLPCSSNLAAEDVEKTISVIKQLAL